MANFFASGEKKKNQNFRIEENFEKIGPGLKIPKFLTLRGGFVSYSLVMVQNSVSS